MIVFADSSALVKLYADEVGHEVVRPLELLVVSQLARVEVPAALWRKHRSGELSAEAAALLVAWFEADYFGDEENPPRFAVTQLNASILDAASRLSGVHGLRAYDAVQLASALAARATTTPEDLTFAAFDKSLCEAASAEAFPLLVS